MDAGSIGVLLGFALGVLLTNISWFLWDRKMLKESQAYREQKERRRNR